MGDETLLFGEASQGLSRIDPHPYGLLADLDAKVLDYEYQTNSGWMNQKMLFDGRLKNARMLKSDGETIEFPVIASMPLLKTPFFA